MGNSVSINEELVLLNEFQHRPSPEKERELVKMLKVLFEKAKTNVNSVAEQFNTRNGPKNWNAFAIILSGSSEKSEENVQTVLQIIEMLLTSQQHFNAVKQKIMFEVYKVDIGKTTILKLITDIFSDKKAYFRLNALNIIEKLMTDEEFLKKEIQEERIDPYLKMLETDMRSHTDLARSVFPYKNICLKVLNEMFENEEGDDLKEKCRKNRGIEIITRLLVSVNSVQEIDTEISVLKVLAILCTHPNFRDDIEFTGEFDEIAFLFSQLRSTEAKFHMARFLVNMSENTTTLVKMRRFDVLETIADGLMVEGTKDKMHGGMRTMFFILAVGLSGDAENTSIMKNSGIVDTLSDFRRVECEDPSLLKYIVYAFEKVAGQAVKPKDTHELYKVLVDPSVSIITMPRYKDIKDYYHIFDALENLSYNNCCFSLWSNHSSIQIMIKKALEIMHSKEAEDIVLYNMDLNILKKLITIIVNMFMAREGPAPPSEAEILDLLIDAQEFSPDIENQELDIYDGDLDEEAKCEALYEIKASCPEIRNSAKLALASVTSMEVETREASDIFGLYKMIFKLMESNIIYQFRALCCLSHLALDLHRRQILLQSNLIKKLVEMLEYEREVETYPFIVREAARILANLFVSPEGMILWMKFNSSKPSIDSSLNHYPLTYGNPIKLYEANEVIFDKWGVKMSQGDVFEIPGNGIDLEEFSVACWFHFPFSSRAYNFHTLVQDAEGLGGLIVIDEKCSFIGTFDDVTGELIESPIDLQSLYASGRTWHHLAVTVEVNPDYPKTDKHRHKVTYYLDGEQEGDPKYLNAPTNVKYIGNSKDARESFGRMADLRIYPYTLLPTNIKELYILRDTYTTDENFDNAGGAFMSCTIDPIPIILHSVKFSIPDMQAQLCRLIAAMSTTRVSRMEFVKRNTYDILIKNIMHGDEKLRVEASRALMYLS